MTDARDPDQQAEPDAETAPPAPAIVDWGVIGRRLRLSALSLLGAALLAWIVVGALRGGIVLADLWGYVGLAFAGMFIAELVFVGGSAVRGMLRAGERGERLAGSDVGILPPQVGGRRRREEP